MSNLEHSGGDSPFDAIKHTDERGDHYIEAVRNEAGRLRHYARLRVLVDGDKHATTWHPTWRMEYLTSDSTPAPSSSAPSGENHVVPPHPQQ